MSLLRELKPLFANLKRLNIGEYLNSKQFELLIIEHDYDDEWNDCYNELTRKQIVFTLGTNDNKKKEEALACVLNEYYTNMYASFDNFITNVILDFINWSDSKIDLTKIYENLKELEVKKRTLLNFIQESRSILKAKTNKNSEHKKTLENMADKSKVFIVHGHDNQLKLEVARFIEKLKIQPIILHEQASSGKTIIEKIEQHTNVGFGIVLYTPCDVGAKNEEKPTLKQRARQNVVFEHGYLIGKIGRGNVCALVKGNVETPNDISGVVYIPTDEEWQIKIAKELKNCGYLIDMNLVIN